MAKVYAVRKGRVPGLYSTWDECKKQVDGFSGAQYKSFPSEAEAKAYIGEEDNPFIEETPDPFPKEATNGPFAFVDGSYNQATKVYGYGGFLCVDKKWYPLKGNGKNAEMASMRNVAGEICGAMAAVKKAEELHLKELTILYDYMGVEEWAVGRWRTSKKGTKEYARFMQEKMKHIHIRFWKVKGHTGVDGNETADLMAKSAVGIKLTDYEKNIVRMIERGDSV